MLNLIKKSPIEHHVYYYLKMHPRRSNREYQLFANKALQIVKAKLGAANDGIITRRDNYLTTFLKEAFTNKTPSRYSRRQLETVKRMLQQYLGVTVDPFT